MGNKIQCQGCGVPLQTDDEAELGYIPNSALQREQLLCQRCFQLRHYNKNETVPLTSDDFLHLVSTIRNKDGLVVHLIDIFDVEGTLLKSLPRIVGEKPVLLVANKVDLLPKSTNQRKLKNWLFQKAKEVNVKVKDVLLISAQKGYHMNEIAMQMETERNNQDIYVVGVTNVGKSTFINKLIQGTMAVKDAITTSHFPGTTLGFIQIPLDKKSAIIDTPGIVNEQQMAHFVSKVDLKVITPKKEIKSRNYQLNREQTLFFGGLGRLNFIKGERQTFVCYFANELPIHRTKLSKADALYENQLGKLLSPPNDETLTTLPPLVKQAYRITQPKTDIVFSGLGWVTVLTANVTVEVYSPKGVAVTLRSSFI